MAVGDWLSTLAEDHRDDVDREMVEESVARDPTHQKGRLALIYQQQGLSEADAHEMTDLLMQKPEAFISTLLMYEYGIMPEEDATSPLKSAAVTFLSFAVCSAIPMLAYAFCGHYSAASGVDYLFWISIGLFAVTLFVLGAVKGKITNSGWLKQGVFTVLQGLITAAVAYAISYGFERLQTLS